MQHLSYKIYHKYNQSVQKHGRNDKFIACVFFFDSLILLLSE